MKKLFFLILLTGTSMLSFSQVVKIVISTSGELKTLFTEDEKQTVNELVVSGSIDARDFKFIQSSLKNLFKIDLFNATISNYSGSEGPTNKSTSYPENELPTFSFSYRTELKGMENLQTVILPGSLKTIGVGAFGFCGRLNTVEIFDSVTSIASMAFLKCNALKSINLPRSLASISDDSFDLCSAEFIVDSENQQYSSNNGILYNKEQTSLIKCPNSKTSVIIPESVEEIKSTAFYGCSIVSVQLPSSLIKIGQGAFNQCNKLEKIYIPSTVTAFGKYAFSGCSSLKTVFIDEGIEEIPDGAFLDCDIVDLSLPLTLKSIGDEAFKNSRALQQVTIPAHVETVGDEAFGYCYALRAIYSISFDPPMAGGAFWFVDKAACILHVPFGRTEAYRNANSWSDFFEIKEMEATLVENCVNKSKITIFPNPINDYVKIYGVHYPCEVQIIDMGGNVQIHKYITEENFVLQTDCLSAGVYLLKTNEINSEVKLIKK